MSARILVDFHHSSLLRSHVLMFEKRLGIEVFRPIGMEWYEQGYWSVYDSPDTARQFLDYGSQPLDETPPLNEAARDIRRDAGAFTVYDPGMKTLHKACTLDYFINHEFDYVLASIPQHVPLFAELIRKYKPNAKLIVQIGNNWNLEQYAGMNVLASITPQLNGANSFFYHQEFDLTVFYDTPVPPTRTIYSFVNLIENTGIGWNDYTDLKRQLERRGWKMQAYGGQCPDGNMTGAHELARKMREAALIFHVKPGGDGYGHILHNAYAVGRPIITRPSHYRGQLGEQLLTPDTFIDLDRYGRPEVRNILTRLIHSPDELADMGRRAAAQFDRVVNFEQQAEGVREWLKTLV